MTSAISWIDAEGPALLTNEKPEPAARFNDWTVSRVPVGVESIQVSTGVTFVTQFRKDQLVAFQIHAIPEDLMSLMGRLEYHLLNGHIIALAGDRTMADDFALCTLSPDTEPDIQQSDAGNREYTMTLELRALTPEEIENIPDTEIFYPPPPPTGVEGDCLTPNSTTTAATSGLSPTRVRGDDFSAWAIDEYPDFLADTVTNPNYEDSVRGSYTTHPLPNDLPAYFFELFDDVNASFPFTPPEGQVNRNRISQLSVNGGHRTVKAIKTADDYVDLFNGFEIHPQHEPAAVAQVRYTSLWTRLRFQFSANFPLGQTDVKYTYPVGTKGMFFINCEEYSTDGGLGRDFEAVIATGTGAGGFDADTLTIEHKATPNAGTTTFRASLGAVADVICTGTPRELVMYAGTAFDEDGLPVADTYRVAVWMGDAFGTLTKLYDELKPTTVGFAIGEIEMLKPKNHYYVPTGDSVICYECIEWEFEDGDGSDAGTFDPYGLDGFAPVRVLTTIEITPDPFTVEEGATQAMTAQGFDQFSDPIATGALTWDSSDDATATVDSSGVVTGVLAGSCTITATAGAITSNAAACAVTLSGSDMIITTLGYDTVGGSTEAATNNRVYMKKITVADDGVIASIGAYVTNDGGDHVQKIDVALFTDNAGSPERVIAVNMTPEFSVLLESVVSTPVARWLTLPLGVPVSAGDYWIAVMISQAITPASIHYDGSGSDRHYTSGGPWFADAGFYSVTTGTRNYSIRATLLQ